MVDLETEELTKISRKVHTIKGLGEDYVSPKEQWLLDLIEDNLKRGRGVGVYVRQTGKADRNTARRLEKMINDNIGKAKSIVMTSSVQTKDRENWLEKHSDANVLICNPNLVKTGLDLVRYNTLVFYELDYSLYTMDQASRRAWRIIQKHSCEVHYPFYFRRNKEWEVADNVWEDVLDEDGNTIPNYDTMEARGVVIVDKKRQAANFIYGNAGASLSALTEGSGNGLMDALSESMDDEGIVDSRALFQQSAGLAMESDWESEDDEEEVNTRVYGILTREYSEDELFNEIDESTYVPGGTVFPEDEFDLEDFAMPDSDYPIYIPDDVIYNVDDDCDTPTTDFDGYVKVMDADELPESIKIPTKSLSPAGSSRRRRRINLLDAPEDEPHTGVVQLSLF